MSCPLGDGGRRYKPGSGLVAPKCKGLWGNTYVHRMDWSSRSVKKETMGQCPAPPLGGAVRAYGPCLTPGGWEGKGSRDRGWGSRITEVEALGLLEGGGGNALSIPLYIIQTKNNKHRHDSSHVTQARGPPYVALRMEVRDEGKAPR